MYILYKSIPESTEITGIPCLIERLEYDGKTDDPNNWLSICDNIIDAIPEMQVFKSELDEQHTKAIIKRNNILLTSGKLLCSCLGLKK